MQSWARGSFHQYFCLLFAFRDWFTSRWNFAFIDKFFKSWITKYFYRSYEVSTLRFSANFKRQISCLMQFKSDGITTLHEVGSRLFIIRAVWVLYTNLRSGVLYLIFVFWQTGERERERWYIHFTSRLPPLRFLPFNSDVVVRCWRTINVRVGCAVHPLPKTLTVLMTKICHFPYNIFDLVKNSKPSLWPSRLAQLP